MTSTVAQTTVALERIETILSADEVIGERAGAVDPGRVRGAITFDRVSFGYSKDEPVLHEVSFAIEPGQVVGIVDKGHLGIPAAVVVRTDLGEREINVVWLAAAAEAEPPS